MATKFEISDAQSTRVKEWIAEHMPQHTKGIDCTGACVRFTFMPTGLGVVPGVECLYCDARLGLSESSEKW